MNDEELRVRQATIGDVEILVPLFDAYRVFYRKPSNLEAVRAFVKERLAYQQSVFLVAERGGEAVGFTQLYPSFSSGALARIFILNDLYVKPEQRRVGVGSALLEASQSYARSTGAIRLTLSTEVTNTTAQALYARAGWKRDEEFLVYTLGCL